MGFLGRFVKVDKARKKRRVSRIKVDVNQRTVEGLNQAMETAAQADLHSGIKKFRRDIMKKELDHAFNKVRYSDLVEHIPWNNLGKALGPAAKTLSGALPKTREAVRRGIRGGTRGLGKDNALLTSALDFSEDAPMPRVNSHRAARDSSRRRTDMANPRLFEHTEQRKQQYLQDLATPTKGRLYELVKRANLQGHDKTQLASDLFDTLRPKSAKKLKRDVRNSIGLNDRQIRAMDNLEQRLTDKGELSEAQINDAVDQYSEKALKDRAETIAVTETRAAAGTAQVESWMDMQEQGLIDPASMKQWVNGWEEACPKICEPMDGVMVPVGDMFILPNGRAVYSAGTAHPRCRCQQILIEPGDNEAGRNMDAFVPRGYDIDGPDEDLET